ncbi:hypothetical protein KAU11_09615 [Candidatus Babeliales bacterium]|nr:hypothetical protein [Candidatus Babeliales bacterium]
MRLPRKVKINGIPFSVERDKKSSGARFSYSDAKIVVGSKSLADCEVLEAFVHEVAEISCIERGMRSALCKPQDSPEYMFSGNHKKFSDVIADVSTVVSDLMKLE